MCWYIPIYRCFYILFDKIDLQIQCYGDHNIEMEEPTEYRETMEVLYNACYGGYTVSDRAIQMHQQRMNYTKNDESDEFFYVESFERHDPVFLEIFHELGNDFSGKNSRIKVKKIPKKYENHYDIHEYDGLERVDILYSKYEADVKSQNIKNIVLHSTMSNDEKIQELKKII